MALNGQGSKERRSGGSDLRPSRPGRELLGHVRTGTARRDPDEACLPAGVEDRNDGLPVSQRRRALLRPLLVHAALSTQDERRGSACDRGRSGCVRDRRSVVKGKSWSVRVDPGGRRIINKKKE